MKKLLIIDSNSILNRAFYGVRYLSTSDGTPTNAIFGFFNIITKLINEENPDYICAAFDVKAPTFRHKQFDDYKGNRKPMPDDLSVQMPIAKEILSAMDIPVLEMAGYEADDIIGTVSRICDESQIKCLIATGDKDDLQLATKNTIILLTITKSGVSETTPYNENDVFEKYGVTPKEFIDVKALMGDKSDNIPGVMGIGEKTAIKLIQNKKSIESLYEDLEGAGAKGATLKKLQDGKDDAFLSKQLATINLNVPIDFDMEKCIYSNNYKNNNELFEILNRLELKQLIKKLDLTPTIIQKEDNSNIFDEMNCISIINKQQLYDIINDIISEKQVSLIFNWYNDNLLSVLMSYKNNAVVVNQTSSMTKTDILDALIPVLSDENIKKLVFDIKNTMVHLFDKTQIKGITADLAIAAYLINPAKSSYTITDASNEFLGIELSLNTDQQQMSLLDEEDDNNELEFKKVYILKPLWEKLSSKLKENEQESLYYDVELPLVEVLAKMQYRGFKTDGDELNKFGKRLSGDIDLLTKQIYDYAGEEFNINSPKQLGVILFEKLNLPVIKKTKTGYSTNAEVLEKLYDKHPIIKCLFEYRQLTKLKSTYCDGLSAVINQKTGKIHSVFNQTVTVTGRISSTEPNLQNIPTRTALGRELRKMFVASDDDHILIDADYSQIELRVLAHIAHDEVMINAFKNNEDIHAVTASQVLSIPINEVTKEQRSSAKAVNFGIVYGIGEYSLSQDLHISIKKAKEYINGYLSKYKAVHEYMETIKEQAKKTGYVKTLMNRIRYIPELKSSNFQTRTFGERVALNTPIQGTAADIIKLAMVRVEQRLNKEGMKSKLILQVHDELIIDALKSEAEKVKLILKEEMENAYKLDVPLIVDMSCGDSWYDAK